MNFDEITVEILEDGTVKSTTNPVSAANHSTAEGFLKGIADLAGGETKREKRKDVKHEHTHTHGHGHSHSH
jgi:hypothetical protein